MKPLRERLTYANVVATIALVLAVAGGTAPALVDNSPTTVFDAEKGLSEDTVKIMDLPAIGDFRASCALSGGAVSGEVIAGWKNRTDSRQLVFLDDGGPNPTVHSVQPGGVATFMVLIDTEMLELDIFRPRDGGTPMAQLSIAVYFPDRDCDRVVVAAVGIGSE